MWEICANKLLPKALKSCPKSNKSPNLVTLVHLLPARQIVSVTFNSSELNGQDVRSYFIYVAASPSVLFTIQLK